MSERRAILRTPKSYRETDVPVQRSIGHIEGLLEQFGCEPTSVEIVRVRGSAICRIRFGYAAPGSGDRSYAITLGLGDDPKDHRQRMRMLFWYIKATLEADRFGVVSIEEAMLPFAEITDGSGQRTTVARALLGEHVELPLAAPDELLHRLHAKALPAPRPER